MGIKITTAGEFMEVTNWLEQNIGPNGWRKPNVQPTWRFTGFVSIIDPEKQSVSITFDFDNEHDAVAFSLRWGS